MTIVKSTVAYVNEYMSKYDASHDFSHVLRVLDLAKTIERSERQLRPHVSFDSEVITLASLLHDVGDKKYLNPGETGDAVVHKFLLQAGASDELASKVQKVVTNVSYSSEIKNPAAVKLLVDEIPELGVVQDADRLDALGAVGIGRCFTFGAAKGGDRGMEDSIIHFEEKLEKLAAMMKTVTGAKLAERKTQRIRLFKAWWREEAATDNIMDLILRHHEAYQSSSLNPS